MKLQVSPKRRHIMPTRRDFLATVSAYTVGAAAWPALAEAARGSAAPRGADAPLRFAVHAMTWVDDYVHAIEDIGAAGFHGVQLRTNVLPAYGDKPADLKALLAKHKVDFVCFSSGTLLLAPDKEA